MVNHSLITAAVASILAAGTTGYTIERNSRRNDDPNVAAAGSGWIGIRKGDADYEAYCTGSSPWLVKIDTIVEVQCATWESAAAAESLIEAAVSEILGVLNSNRKLNDTVAMTNGYKVTHEINENSDAYHYAAIITIHSEVRA